MSFTDLIKCYIIKQFTFFIFTEGEGLQLGNAFEFVLKFFYFFLPFTYRQNSEIKVTVKLTGSTVFCLFNF